MTEKEFAAKKDITSPRSFEYGVYQLLDRFLGKGRVNNFLGKRRKAFSAKLMEELIKSGKGRGIQIERRKDLSLDEFKNHYRKKGIPVIMEGAANNWDCVKKWSLEYFKELHGKDVIALTNHKFKEAYETTTLADIIDNIRSGGGKYYRFYPLLFRHPEHIKDFDYKWLLERRNSFTWFEAWHVFIGGKGTVTPFHMENQCNLFVQVYGEKKWIIYPNDYNMVLNPDAPKHMYRNPAIKPEVGPFNAFQPNFEAYPEYQYINWLEADLKPGDVLFNPCFNWHTVENTTDSIGVGYRWVAPLYAIKLAPLLSFLDLFMRNPSIFKSAKLYIEDTNLIRVVESGNLEKYLKEKAEKEKLQEVNPI
ncbi:MAG TPA: cupin-like domain-containing protein [Bacteroidia bacterium]|jgi:hypothetical protein|nr:cupin-like domain-containing protein [Bacteroidia bacterium]